MLLLDCRLLEGQTPPIKFLRPRLTQKNSQIPTTNEFFQFQPFTKGKSTFFLSKCNHAFFYRDIMRGQENEGGRAQIKHAHNGVKLFLGSLITELLNKRAGILFDNF